MATWDGSYQEPEASNYYVNSTHGNHRMVNVPTWNYYYPPANNMCAQNVSVYPMNAPVVYEQTQPNLYTPMDGNSIPPRVYPHNEIHTINNTIHTRSSDVHANASTSQSQGFLESNRMNPQHLQSYYYNNLQVTPNEFASNNDKQDYGVNANGNDSSNDRINNVYPNQSSHRSYDTVFFEDNKTRGNSRGFENKRPENFQYHNNGKINYCRSKNFRKYPNDKHNFNRNDTDKLQNNQLGEDESESIGSQSTVKNKQERVNKSLSRDQNNYSKNTTSPDSSVEANSSKFVKTSKTFLNNGHAERYYDRKVRYNPRDFKQKKVNYSESNGYNRNHYNKDNKYDRWDNRNYPGDSRDKEIIDWRQKANNKGKKSTLPTKNSNYKKYEADDDASQRERLTEQLNRGQLECLVCCEFIRQADYVWSCNNCYHVLHLKCVQKWAVSSQDESGWRCPACQNVTSDVPSDYKCFCGKATVPEWNRREVAHSCGEICGRARVTQNCVHKCTLLCHPGSCPPCVAMVTKSCGCGRTSQTQKCSVGTLLRCEEICDRILNCGIHKCVEKCHHGSCEPCNEIIKQECFCGKESREETCVLDLSPFYSCKNVCDKQLDCGNHKCTQICHPGECSPCALKPENVTHCCCGQTALTEKRESCLDPIPNCDKLCCKKLKCGQPSNPHTCQTKCHDGDCPECELSTKVKCRCGFMDKEILCKELTTKADDARCEKKCTKKRSCGKHKCNQMCCIDIDHVCPILCSKTLSCGKHKCEQTCHKGRCQTCWRSSFDELYCECGASVIYPPIACGTRRPACDKPCSREHPCDHEVFHNCHSDLNCPPCTVLTQKWCYGEHELRKAVPCYVTDVSCGLPCNKPLSCGRHKCIQICHSGPCEKPGQVCTQPCTIARELCGHICAANCHEGKCPDTPCKEMVKVTCQCGNRVMSRVCEENSRDYQRIVSGILASKMADMQLGHTVDLEEVFGQSTRKQNQLRTLECNDDCKTIERNRKITLGLQIANPDLSGKLMPRYCEHMKQWGKKDPEFCQMVHVKLTELVQLAKSSKQKSRSYSFEIMNRDKRQFVHESCEHFGCESQAYDQEPKRNVVATAVKDKCWLPSYSLLEVLQRENGQRKPPIPGSTLNRSKLNSLDRSIDVLQLNPKRNLKTMPAASPSKSPEPETDYFNYKG